MNIIPKATTICTLGELTGFFIEYKGAGWYTQDGWWTYIIEDDDGQYCVMEWENDPRPLFKQIQEAAVHD